MFPNASESESSDDETFASPRQISADPDEDEILLKRNEPDEATQAARLRALRGKRCLWLTAPCIPGMSEQMVESLRWALDQGVEIIACFGSENEPLFKLMSRERLMSTALLADLGDDVQASASVLRALQGSGIVVDAVFSPYEMMQTVVGEVAQALALPGNPAKAYTAARSKHLARQATAEAGLATPRFGIADAVEDVAALVSRVGLPCILKPSSGAGSCGVLRVGSLPEAVAAYEAIRSDMRESHLLSYNPGCAPAVIVEELLEGDEFDVDILMWGGRDVYSQCVLNWPSKPPYFLETGSQMPTGFPAEKVEALRSYAVACLRAMGFLQGCFHVEVMLTAERGPVLVEVNARQGGGPNQVFNAEMCGVDMFANFFIAAFGIPINPPRHAPAFAMADYAITSPYTGILFNDDHMETIRAHPAVTSTQDYCKPGNLVQGLDSGFPEWTNQFFVKAASPDACRAIVETLVTGIEAKITVLPPSASAGPPTRRRLVPGLCPACAVTLPKSKSAERSEVPQQEVSEVPQQEASEGPARAVGVLTRSPSKQ